MLQIWKWKQKHKQINQTKDKKHQKTEIKPSENTQIGDALLEIALSQPDRSGFLSDEQKKEWEAIEDGMDIRKINTVDGIKAMMAIKLAQEANAERRQELIDEVNAWASETPEAQKRDNKKIQKILGYTVELE